ncbi:monovalent cation:proton antiporter-2 (CPA2) family protein [Pararhizobium mangrovi]|uniref:Potassium transporter TrkA n=1 Tax=Pararhizobium mangrovi TaxID=2590452 RepID=A0A506TZ60_9HYPH|nr:monovalent cation:proton antiporter-2 (CPA2) family protein [Pararhizobium mangrovi]TPW26596.1 potassium transporter TrkA [Pararhizobium mangrovi]
MTSGSPNLYAEALLLLTGAVIAAPLFKRLGLATVLGYLAAGIVIGPVLRIIGHGREILEFAELGVVFLLFVIGLELKPSRLWQMRRAIFGLGTAQVLLGGVALAGCAVLAGSGTRAAIVVGFGLALSSTAFALQLLQDANEANAPHGRIAFSILLLQDLAIVPLLAVIPLLAPFEPASTSPMTAFAIAVAAVVALVLAGRYLLNPLFSIIARTGAREAMIAAALLVVLGAASLMQLAGLSMAMGAFLAGVMLAESAYRHELEADIEPFRGILLGLFFMGVGLSLDLTVIARNWMLLVAAVPVVMAVKALTIYGVCRLFGAGHNDAVRIAGLLPQGGEFGFVLFTSAASAGIFPMATASLLIAIVTLTMALTPLTAALAERLLKEEEGERLDEDFDGAGSDVLMIGFSRFGQIACQILLAGGSSVTVIDHSADRVRQAMRFGFRIYFGDGTRKDVLEAAGIGRARVVAICTQKKEITDRIVDLVQTEYPSARIFARSYDRVHTLALRERRVAYELRETFESGLLFGRRTLEELGLDGATAEAIGDDIRRRDEERLILQASEGINAGRGMIFNRPATPAKPLTPQPLTKPRKAEEDGETRRTPAEIE